MDFLVMELVTGPTLEQELRKGPLPEKDVVRLGSQLARGLVAAHEHGVIHRDLKPSNLQLTSDGMLKILDFGVAHLERGRAPTGGEATATETAAGEVLGSPPYMAPEQLLGKAVDARTDMYAAGACLYELATGKRPHGDKRGPQLTEAILHEVPVAPRGANGGLSRGPRVGDPEGARQGSGASLPDGEGAACRPGAPAGRGDGGRGQPASRGRKVPTTALARARGRGRARGDRGCRLARAPVGSAAAPRDPARDERTRLQHDDPLHGFRSWATDGSRLYFVGMKDGRSALMQVPVTGGEPAEISVPFVYKKVVFGYDVRRSTILMGGSEQAEVIDCGQPRRVAALDDSRRCGSATAGG